MDYRASGVDRDLADGMIEDLKPKIRATFRPEVESDIGDFGGFFRIPSNYKEPVLVATTDGVGTKLVLAEMARAHRSIAQDLVGMCVNDLLCCRAEPLIFLDYIATGKIERKALDELVIGIAEACKKSGCSLVGGETAEMPGFYAPSRYDVAGFSVGVMERSKKFKPANVKPGDKVFGFRSSGFHSNGFSLVRKVVEDQKWKYEENFEGKSLLEHLLVPTELYVSSILPLFSSCDVRAAAHITGGGLIDNLPRGFDENFVSVVLQKSKIPTLPVMKRFVEAAKMDEREAFSTWNMGIGFCVIAPGSEAATILKAGAIEIGEVVAKQAQAVVLQ